METSPNVYLYVVDSGNNRIQKLSSTGEYVTQWGTYGTGDGQFNRPTDISKVVMEWNPETSSVETAVYVADSGNNRIQKFATDGTFLAKWGTSGTGDGQFDNPTGIAVETSPNVYLYVVDSGNNRIQKLSSTGEYVTQWGTYGTGDGQFDNPTNISYVMNWNPQTSSIDIAIYIVDSGNNRIQKFAQYSTGSITGTITRSSDGQPLPNKMVFAINPQTGTWVASSSLSAADGSYTISGLTPGNYKIQFAGDDTFAIQYYNTATFSSATPVTVTAGTTTGNINFSLIPGGNITGIITRASDGQPVSGLYVSACDAASGAGIKGSAMPSAADGSYTLTGLVPGSYKFRVNTESSGFATQWYLNASDQTSATPVMITAGVTTNNINFNLAAGGSITGIITRASDGQAVSGVTVRAYNATTGAYIKSGSASTADGSYTISDLVPGNYKLRAEPGSTGLSSQWYNNAPDQQNASVLTVTSGVTTSNINFTLVQGGNITGRITRASDGAALSGITVNAYNATTGGFFKGSSSSAADGSYLIPGLPPGNYTIQYSGSAMYAVQYYNGTSVANSAVPVTVTAGVTTSNINFNLVACGNITGRVTRASDGQPVSGMTVSAFGALNNASFKSATTAADGSYTISGLPAGLFKLRVNPGNSGYSTKWFNDALDQTAAERVFVGLGMTVENVNFSLTADAGYITGTITRASDGQPVSGLRVDAYDAVTGAYVFGTLFNSAADGSYTIPALRPGSYKIQAKAGNSGLATQYYLNADSYTAVPVTVTSGTGTGGINFNLPQGNTIAGYVTRASDGRPISDWNVIAYSTADNGSIEWSLPGSTRSDGYYRITGLPDGRYKVMAANGFTDNYAIQFYQNASYSDFAQAIELSSGQTVENINFSLSIGGAISGTIRDASTNLPLGDQYVTIYSAETGQSIPFRAIRTDAQGRYAVGDLPSGNYRVLAGGSANYIAQWYNNVFLNPASTPVVVTAGSASSGIDFSLSSGAGAISGTVVRKSDNQPLAGVGIVVHNEYGRVKFATTAFDGSYIVHGLPAGTTYTVSAEPRNNGYAGVFYPDAPTRDTATLITVVSGQTTPNVNFSLETGGSVSGVVRTNTGVPLPGMRVVAIDWTSGNSVTGSADTQYDGSYMLTGLAEGNYKIRVSAQPMDFDNEYVAQYYNNTAQGNSASMVSVVSGQVTTGINFGLPPGGKLSGVVRSASTNSPISGLQVRVYDSVSRSLLAAGGITALDGSYVVTGLPAGNYFVHVDASPSGFLSMFYNGVTDMNYATPVSVTVGQTTQNINFNLFTSSSSVLNSPTLNLPANSAVGQPTNMTLSWNDTNSSPQEQGYTVRIKPSGGSYTELAVGQNITSLGLLLSNSTTYYWSVKAVGDGSTTSDSPWSEERTFTTQGIAQYTLTATMNGTGSGTISAIGLTCTGATCTGSYASGTPVTLTANAILGSTFTRSLSEKSL